MITHAHSDVFDTAAQNRAAFQRQAKCYFKSTYIIYASVNPHDRLERFLAPVECVLQRSFSSPRTALAPTCNYFSQKQKINVASASPVGHELSVNVYTDFRKKNKDRKEVAEMASAHR